MLAATDLAVGDALTRWSIQLAVTCYMVRVCLDLRSSHRGTFDGRRKITRWFWTAGCALYVFHVLCAFGFYHHWSHLAAYRHTAEQTAALTGIHWGGGLYINYAFTVLWLCDLAAWWLGGVDFPYRSSGYLRILHGTFAFMMFSATVVFGPPVWKWVAIPVAVLLIFMTRRPQAANTAQL